VDQGSEKTTTKRVGRDVSMWTSRNLQTEFSPSSVHLCNSRSWLRLWCTTGVSGQCWPAVFEEIRGVWGYRNPAVYRYATVSVSPRQHVSYYSNFRFVHGIHRSAATHRTGYHVSSQQDVKKQWMLKATGLLTWHAFIVTMVIRETSLSTLRWLEITSLQLQESFLSQEAFASQAKIFFAQSWLQYELSEQTTYIKTKLTERTNMVQPCSKMYYSNLYVCTVHL
jgi:hypothetical protein